MRICPHISQDELLTVSVTSYLVCTLATDSVAVGVFDRSRHVAVSNNGQGEGNSMSETAAPVYKWKEKR